MSEKKQYIVTMVHEFSVEYAVIADSAEEAQALAYHHLNPATYSGGLVGPDVRGDYDVEGFGAIFPSYQTQNIYQGSVTEVELDDDARR